MTRGFCVAFALTLVISLLTAGSVSPGAAQSAAPEPGDYSCLLNFSRDAVLTDGQGPLSLSRNRLRTFHADCRKVRLVRGEATAFVRSGERYMTLTFESGQLDPAMFKGAPGPPGVVARLWLFGQEFFGTAPFGAGSRGGADEQSRFLSRAFNGTLVVGPDGLQLPIAAGPLEGLSAFRVVTGNVLRDPVAGVSFSAGAIRFDAGALQPGRSYAWEGTVTTPTGNSILSGAFDVADATRRAAMDAALQARLAGIEPTDPRYLLEAAALYEERGHGGNAAILTARWFAGL